MVRPYCPLYKNKKEQKYNKKTNWGKKVVLTSKLGKPRKKKNTTHKAKHYILQSKLCNHHQLQLLEANLFIQQCTIGDLPHYPKITSLISSLGLFWSLTT